MPTEDPQNTWDEYYKNKKTQRLEEASAMWQQLENAGVTEETVIAIDFVHFGNNIEDVKALAEQLSENYKVKVSQHKNEKYWLVNGTTRPTGVNLSKEQHLGWVEFMTDVAQSYACVFSTWALEAPVININVRSEDIESTS